MAWPAATSLLMLLLMTIASSFSPGIIVTTPAPFGRILKAVKVHGGYMEVIQEERCSQSLLRLTCRSLRAFIFILEADYHANHTKLCQKESKSLEELKVWRNKGSIRRWANVKELKGNYIFDDEDNQADVVDIRSSMNKRCSGLKHCRYNVTTDHPGAHSWIPGGILLKYACIPAAVRRYCNQEVKVTGGEGGYVNTPGYPLYYVGETCGWTFRTFPDQRIALTFHDLNIRGPNVDGNCVDVVRVRERGSTLLEFCGTAAGVRIISHSNVLTLDFVASQRFYNARGFLLQYQVLGCPEVSAPNGSYVSNGTLTSRTFLCKSGSVFPDSGERKRTLVCRSGKWNETATKLPGCVATSAVIVKSENEHHHLASLSGDNILGSGVRLGRGEDAVASGSISPVMDSAQSAMMKQADYVVDVVLPTVIIALLFVGNAIIVYIIFQFRKRKLTTTQSEEIALRGPPDVPNV
ncbi:hypothetical protein PUN28_020147 [Cardiocondyla obscurior]|uniref:CUB domain-containing protein n=1 Tax=Cardiocondyla obscurior TaxID=286306 RepID=A0AAW2E7K2_9HYME